MGHARVNWRMRWLGIVVVALLMAIGAQPAFADGIIIPDPPPGMPVTEVQNLTIRYHRVNVTIDGPIATTHVDQVFVNEASYTIEGTYIFPLPADAAISEFAMTVDGKRMVGELLERDEARRIYEDIVRRRRDPALLEYVGRGAFQASIFPIPAGGERRIEIEYTQVLEAEAGLIHYSYPLDTERFSARPIEEVSVSVEIRSKEPLRAIYSPSHDVVVSREGEFRAHVGYEESNTLPDRDFELYFSTSAEPFGLNVLSYKPAGEDGFFLLLASPQMVQAERQEVIARDIIFVLDTSGSMQGDKIEQAKGAVIYVLDHLNPDDRFNIIDFSTGVRSYATRLVPAERRADAKRYVEERIARGGTDINRALLEALSYTGDSDRPQVIIFLTDGLATEGVKDAEKIIANVDAAAGPKVRIFTFGVGYDVNTILLDTIAQSHRGASAYILPGENIEEKVSAFYAKISAPVLSDPQLDFGMIHVEDTYPYPLPDFFMGSQLVMVGRYRSGGETTITLRGEFNGRLQEYTYRHISFTQAGGNAFIARLWAIRKVGYLLTQIRVHGEDKELIDELVELSIRYGVITPYTSFLVEEDEALTSSGREKIVQRELKAATAEPMPAFGAKAVEKSMIAQGLGGADVAAPPQPVQEIRHVEDKVFVNRDGVWVDTLYDAEKMTAKPIAFGSPAYFDLLSRYPGCGRYLAVGRDVIVVLDGKAYRVSQEGATEPEPAPIATATPKPATTATAASGPATTPSVISPTPTPVPWYESFWYWLQGLLWGDRR